MASHACHDLRDIYTTVPDGLDLIDSGLAVLAKLGVEPEAARLLASVVGADLRGWQREFASLLERDAIGLLTPRSPNAGRTEQESAPEARAQLLASTFALYDGTRVTWGEATVDQHAQRIARLDRLRQGTTNTIDRHKRALALITAANATCLNDLDVVDLEGAA